MRQKILDAHPERFSWVTSCQVNKGVTYRWTFPNELARGLCLEQGRIMHNYYEYKGKRPTIAVYLSGEPRKVSRKWINATSWAPSVDIARGVHRMRILKSIALQANLKRSQELYCYREQDENDAPIVRIYLDGKPREKGGEKNEREKTN